MVPSFQAPTDVQFSEVFKFSDFKDSSVENFAKSWGKILKFRWQVCIVFTAPHFSFKNKHKWGGVQDEPAFWNILDHVEHRIRILLASEHKAKQPLHTKKVFQLRIPHAQKTTRQKLF